MLQIPAADESSFPEPAPIDLSAQADEDNVLNLYWPSEADRNDAGWCGPTLPSMKFISRIKK